MNDLLSLYKLPEAYENVLDALEESGGEVTDEIAAQLALIQDSLEVKSERVAQMIRQHVGLAEMRKSEADRLAKLAARDQRKAESLRGYLLKTFEELGVTKFDTERFRFRVQRNSTPSVTWTGDAQFIPEAFRKEVPPPAPTFDPKKVLEVWKNNPDNPELPAGFSVSIGTHVRIS